MCDIDTQSTILEPLTFSVQVIRNISQPTEAFPNVDIQLQLNQVKVLICSTGFISGFHSRGEQTQSSKHQGGGGESTPWPP